jgi:hypothetical protein
MNTKSPRNRLQRRAFAALAGTKVNHGVGIGSIPPPGTAVVARRNKAVATQGNCAGGLDCFACGSQ